MLVLTRKPNERIVLTRRDPETGEKEETTIMVVRTDRRRVRLGIESPDHYQITRA